MQAKQNTDESQTHEKIRLAIMGSYDETNQLQVDIVKRNILEEVDVVKSISGKDFPLKVSTTDGKLYIVEKDGTITETFKIQPTLSDDMTPVYWDENNLQVETDEADDNWFDYDIGNWANATTEDGSYWVWIPRFEYKITYTDESDYGKGGNIDIKIIPTTQTTADNGYIIHPAFTNEKSTNYANGGWDAEISGFWVAKFEMSMEENGSHVETSSSDIGNRDISSTIRPVSKPNVTCWYNILPGKAYINSYNYDSDKKSHLMKNSEWGAVAYFAYSKYGLNGTELCINTSNITGQSTGKTDGSKSDINYAYDTPQGVTASTTRNITGIYDMSGGLWEFTASYNSSDTSTKLANNGLGYFVKNADNTPYIMAYKNDENNKNATNTLGKIGDGIKELRNKESNAVSWFNDTVYVPYNSNPFSIRGGYNGSGIEAGIFCAGYNSGSASGNKSFRIVLIND